MKIKGSIIILEKDGKFLLQLRDNTKKIHNPNTWGLFGGHINEGENPLEAIIREIKEELGLKLKKELIKRVAEFINEEREIYVFRSLLEKDLSEMKLNEGQDMRLFSYEEISNLDATAPGLKRLMENFRNNFN